MKKQDIDYQIEVRGILCSVTTLPINEIMKITKNLKKGENYTPQFIAAFERLVKLVKEKKI